MSLPKIKLREITHHGEVVVVLKFDYNQELIDIVKSIGGAKWSKSKQGWYFNKDDFHLPTFFKALQPVHLLIIQH